MIRTLTAEEYPRLKTVADGYVPDPKSSIVIVSEENGEIVGRTMLVCVTHLEGTWVREDKRSTMLALRLMQRAQKEAKQAGLTQLLAYTELCNRKIRKYMQSKFMQFRRLPIAVWNRAI